MPFKLRIILVSYKRDRYKKDMIFGDLYLFEWTCNCAIWQLAAGFVAGRGNTGNMLLFWWPSNHHFHNKFAPLPKTTLVLAVYCMCKTTNSLSCISDQVARFRTGLLRVAGCIVFKQKMQVMLLYLLLEKVAKKRSLLIKGKHDQTHRNVHLLIQTDMMHPQPIKCWALDKFQHSMQ